jgi:tetratricopeptide (TPR) repeat protein
MKRTTILFFVTFLSLNGILKSQSLQDSDTIKSIKNAEYLKEDLTKFLQSNTKYPLEALENNIQGNVILSFEIRKDGKLNNLKVISSPDKILSTSSIISFNNMVNEWSPCKNNGNPIDKEYLIVFRYRIYFNTQPLNDNEKAEKFIKKQKYEKALKQFDAAIKENSFDYKLFESRSKIKEILGDTEGAKNDYEQSSRLQNEILTLVDVNAIGITRVENRTEIRIEKRTVY